MRNFIVYLLALGMAIMLCSCGESSQQTKKVSGYENSEEDQKKLKSSSEEPEYDKLKLLCNRDDYGSCYTKNGYYYLTEDTRELADGTYGSHLMYMDFAAKKEIYLCSNAGCRHNTPDCPSVFLYDDFPSISTMIFIYKDYLYILSKELDDDGALYENIDIIGDDSIVKSTPAVLYRVNLDGTNREKVYTFENSLILEDIVLGDDNGIYVVTKKLSSEKNSSGNYMTSSERKLVFIDLKSNEERIVCNMEFGDDISWNIYDCFDTNIVLSGFDYGRKLSVEEIFNDNAYKDLYENSDEVFALLDLKTGNITRVCSFNNKEEHSAIINGNMLYVSYSGDGSIRSVDLSSKAENNICTLKNNYIYTLIGDKLCCGSWDMTSDQTYYYVDINTGEVSHSGLVNKCNGWSLEFCAVLDSEVLVIYDYEAKKLDDEAYDITRYQFGLISKEDLFAGNDNYQTIKMIGRGR